MVFIHGGSLKGGSHWQKDGENIVGENNVVFVAMNYRVGPFGNVTG
jgi:carboxylesterase type B